MPDQILKDQIAKTHACITDEQLLLQEDEKEAGTDKVMTQLKTKI